MLEEINTKFLSMENKLIRTVTANGSNFIAALKELGQGASSTIEEEDEVFRTVNLADHNEGSHTDTDNESI